MRQNIEIKRSRDYLTNFFKRRSIIALCSSICTLILAFLGIVGGIMRTIYLMKADGYVSFIFYTMLSNILAIFSTAFLIPYAVEGIKKKRFVLPKWVAVLNYIAVTSITVMLVFVLAFMSWTSPFDAFDGSNMILHIYCPALILLSFFQIENGYTYSVKNRFIGCLPFHIYAIVYSIKAFIIGEANGGWPDIYKIKEYMPPLPAVIILMLLGLGVSWFIASISNYLTKKREQKMFLYWQKDVDPVEAKIEAYGLGNMMGKIKDEKSMVIPLDILNYLAEKAKLNVDELINPYIKGLMNANKAG